MRHLTDRAILIVCLMNWTVFLVLASVAWRPLQAQTAADGADPFLQCVAEGSDSETACLSRLGDRFGWLPTQAACRFIANKTGAIIAAGGQVEWIELFYNERCARLEFPHDATAAAAGARLDFTGPFAQCADNERFSHPTECYELLGRHSFHPRWESFCVLKAEWIRRYRSGEYPLSLYGLFQHERCWRLGLAHYQGD